MRAELLDPFDYVDDVVDGGAGDDAVAEVEDVAGASVAAVRISRTRDLRTSSGAKRVMGSRLPWTATALVEGLPAEVEGDAPVEAEDVGSGLRMVGRSEAVSTPK